MDLPAHLVPGWAVMKSADVLAAALSSKGNEMPEEVKFDKSVLSADATAYVEALEARVAKAEADATVTTEPEGAVDAEAMFEKSLAGLPEPVRKHIMETQKTAAEQAKMVKSLTDEREIARYAEMAKALKHLPKVTAGFGETLRKAAGGDSDAFGEMYEVMKAADGALHESGLFSAIGTDSTLDGGLSGLAAVEAAAATEMAADPTLSKAQAMTKAVEKNPDLYNRREA